MKKNIVSVNKVLRKKQLVIIQGKLKRIVVSSGGRYGYVNKRSPQLRRSFEGLEKIQGKPGKK